MIPKDLTEKNQYKKKINVRARQVPIDYPLFEGIIDIEETVLGAILTEKDALADVAHILQPKHFFREEHKIIYETCALMWIETIPIDPRTVVDRLRKMGQIDSVGGPAYVAELTERVASKAHIEYHARIIVQEAMRRELRKLGKNMQKQAEDPTNDIFDLIDSAENSLYDLLEPVSKKTIKDSNSLNADCGVSVEKAAEKKQGLIGTPTGFLGLDRLTGGWEKKELVVLAARPGMGKTALMLSFMRSAAAHNVPTAFFSIEMGNLQLMKRLWAAESEVDLTKIARGTLSEEEKKNIFHRSSVLARLPFFMDESAPLSLFDFRSRCRLLKAQRGIEVVFVDYLQLMRDDPTGRPTFSREQQVAAISRGLKEVAKELNITVIVASQLSRAVETRGGDKIPQLSDLRDSGAIEQDADKVLFLYRPEYYGITEDEDANNTKGLANIIVAKNRNGQTGKINIKFIPEMTKFCDFSDDGSYFL